MYVYMYRCLCYHCMIKLSNASMVILTVVVAKINMYGAGSVYCTIMLVCWFPLGSIQQDGMLFIQNHLETEYQVCDPYSVCYVCLTPGVAKPYHGSCHVSI